MPPFLGHSRIVYVSFSWAFPVCSMRYSMIEWTPLSLLGLIVDFLPAPELTFAWIFNEYPNFVQQDSRRFISQETGSLYIAKVEPSDVGNYTCVVNNTVTREKVLSSPTPLVLRSDGTVNGLKLSIPHKIPPHTKVCVLPSTFCLTAFLHLHNCANIVFRH